MLANWRGNIDELIERFSDAGPRTEAERARAHFGISEERWESLSAEEKQDYIDKLPERSSGGDLNRDDDKQVGDMSEAEVAEWFGKLSARAWDDLLETERQILMSLYNDKNPKVIQDSTDDDIDDDDCEDCDEKEQDKHEADSETPEPETKKKKADEFNIDLYIPKEPKPDVVIIDPVY